MTGFLKYKNTNSNRENSLAERQLAQELLVGSRNYGKLMVGTDDTIAGEVVFASDKQVQDMYNDQFADGVYSGCDGSRTDVLVGTTNAGVVYTDGVRMEVVSEEHTYADDSTTYVDIDGQSGKLLYVDGTVGNGTQRLAKVVTSGGDITEYADMRVIRMSADAMIAKVAQDASDARAQLVIDADIKYGNKTVTEVYTATDGQTAFNIANTDGQPLTVMLEGFPLDESEYTRDSTKIVLDVGADEGEQVYLIAHNG